MNQPFTEEQKQYLQGFMAGVIQRGGVSFAGVTAGGQITNDPGDAVRDLAEPAAETVCGTPVDDLCKEERIKLERNGLDIWDVMAANAAASRFPEGGDVFRYKFYGLFYVAPAQEAYMLRCRIPGCVLTAAQLHGLARLAEDYGGGYADITTRGNIQIREIGAADPVRALDRLYDIGLTSRGAGADNIRNITASPTAGFDPHEVHDVRPLARALHHYVLNSRDLYGLPRKFNVAFDNGGAVSVASDTNDIGFLAVRVGEGRPVEPGVYFRVLLGGITGHKHFAHDSGLLLRADECVAVAAAMIRVYLEHGDRTNRKKARLVYLLEAWGVERFLAETEKKLAFSLRRLPPEACEPRRPVVRHGHFGVHRQRDGRNYLGVVIPVGRMTGSQMHRLADLAATYGSGDVRLTVWQNLILPGIADADLEAVQRAVREIGFHHEASAISGGLVACTGNAGCKYAMTNTKAQAVALADYLETNVALDNPINIHLTGCPNSCAQHYCGDIGLLGVKTKVEGTSVEGYNVVLGGGMDDDQGLARELVQGVPFEDLPPLLERVIRAYTERRAGDETFVAFTRRHSTEQLQAMLDDGTEPTSDTS